MTHKELETLKGLIGTIVSTVYLNEDSFIEKFVEPHYGKVDIEKISVNSTSLKIECSNSFGFEDCFYVWLDKVFEWMEGLK